MYRKIFLNKSLPIKERFKRFVAYYLKKRGARIQWNKRFLKVLDLYPDFASPADKSTERAHKLYWKPFQCRINIKTMRVSRNISGIDNPKFIP